jgi:hypothetical protein
MTEDTSHTTVPDNPDVQHETSDANILAIFGFGLALLVAAAIVHVLVWLLFGYFAAREAEGPAPRFPLAVKQLNRLPPEPRLQPNPRDDLIELLIRESQVLSTYGWVDKEEGVVRLPIERAMSLTVERGLPARPTEQR